MTQAQLLLIALGCVIFAVVIAVMIGTFSGPNPNSETTIVTSSINTYVVTTNPRKDNGTGVWYATAKLVGHRYLAPVVSNHELAKGDTVIGYKINLYLDGEYQNNVYLAK